MGKVTGFLEIDRREPKYQPAGVRVRHHREFTLPLTDADTQEQAARCMDCGIPYCHTGCPVMNQIPDWNDLVYNHDWQEASRNLHSTNNFPEFTGRICPAPCEEACVLNLEDAPVTIKSIEQAIVDKAWAQGWIIPEPPSTKTGKRIAILGSGPAGMAAAQQLARAGHETHVFEREPKAGGLLRYGIPDFKMEKHHIDRRITQMQAEGVIFHYNADIGKTQPLQPILDEFDATLLACGAEAPRDPRIPGMELGGVHYAMPYLTQQNRRNGSEAVKEQPITATGKNIIVIGGGDTASDCIGTAFRQGALSVTQLDIRPKPPEKEDKLVIWPYWPTKMRTSSSQAEGATREFAIATLAIKGDNNQVTHIECAHVDDKRQPVHGSEFMLKADMVFIAIGFAGPSKAGLLEQINLDTDPQGNVAANDKDYKTSHPKLFTAGDMRRGQSLVVWAIREGRQAARSIDETLMGLTSLPY